MSASYDNTNPLTLFRNKSDNAKAPGWTGPIEIGEDIADMIAKGERKFQLAAWFNKNAEGDQTKDRFNGTISPRLAKQNSAGDQASQGAAAGGQQQHRRDDLDDAIPF